MCLFVQYKCPNNAGVGLSIPHFDSLVGEGQKGREREGNRSIPVFFSPHFEPWFALWFGVGCSRGIQVCSREEGCA